MAEFNIEQLLKQNEQNINRRRASYNERLKQAQDVLKTIEDGKDIFLETNLYSLLKNYEGQTMKVKVENQDPIVGKLSVEKNADGTIYACVDSRKFKIEEFLTSIRDLNNNPIVFIPTYERRLNLSIKRAILYGQEVGLGTAIKNVKFYENKLKSLEEENENIKKNIQGLPELFSSAKNIVVEPLWEELQQDLNKHCLNERRMSIVKKGLEVCKLLNEGHLVEEANKLAAGYSKKLLSDFVLHYCLEGVDFYKANSKRYKVEMELNSKSELVDGIEERNAELKEQIKNNKKGE